MLPLVGYAQMASMMCKWQQLVEDDEWPARDEFHYLKVCGYGGVMLSIHAASTNTGNAHT